MVTEAIMLKAGSDRKEAQDAQEAEEQRKRNRDPKRLGVREDT